MGNALSEKKKIVKRLNRQYFFKKVLIGPLFFLERIGLTFIVAPFVYRLLLLFGVKKNIGQYSNYRRFTKSFKGAFKLEPNQEKGQSQVLFPMMFGGTSNFNLVNLLFAYHLKTQGHQPVFLVCNSAFSICNRDSFGKERKNNPFFCYECYRGYDRYKKIIGIEMVFMKELVYKQNIVNTQKNLVAQVEKLQSIDECLSFKLNNGFAIGQDTKKRMLKFFSRSYFEYSKEELDIFKEYLSNGILYYLMIEEYTKQNHNLKTIIVHNGTLAFSSYLFDIAKRFKKDVITYETYLGANSLIYKKNNEVMRLRWPEEMSKYYEIHALTKENRQKVDDFFRGLKQGKDMYAVLNKDHDYDRFQQLGRYVCLFTNLKDDTAVLDRNTIFKSMEEWIIEVIDFWKHQVKEDIKLVIRVHPAEIKLLNRSLDLVGNNIKTYIDDPRVILIDPTEKVNSYSLIDKMEFGLTYASTITLEALYAGKNCLVAGDPFFLNQPFISAPQTKDEYFEALQNWIGTGELSGFDKDEFYRYIYYIYFQRIKKLDGFNIQHRTGYYNFKVPDFKTLYARNEQFLKEFYGECFLY